MPCDVVVWVPVSVRGPFNLAGDFPGLFLGWRRSCCRVLNRAMADDGKIGECEGFPKYRSTHVLPEQPDFDQGFKLARFRLRSFASFDREGSQARFIGQIMKRKQTDTKKIIQRVRYFVCQLQGCGDSEFMDAMRPQAGKVPRTRDENSEGVVLFSMN